MASGVWRSILKVEAILCAALACSTLSACSPYVFSAEVQIFSSKTGSIDSSYRDNEQKILAEKQLTNRTWWVLNHGKTVSAGPGCTTDPQATNTGPCDLTPDLVPSAPDTSKTVAAASLDAALKTANSTVKPAQAVTPASDVCEAAVSAAPPPKTDTVKLQPAQYLKSLDDYAAALAAVTKAQDRADFDNAAAKVSAAVGTLAGPYASVAKASSNAALWMVGQDLDYRRLQELQSATRIACEPIHDLAKALGGVLEDQRNQRLGGLYSLLIWKMHAVTKARNTPHVTDQAYGAAIDDAQAAAAALQTVRATDPHATAQALSDAHDKLVVAVRNNDGQFSALIISMQTFAQRADELVTAAAATVNPPGKKS